MSYTHKEEASLPLSYKIHFKLYSLHFFNYSKPYTLNSTL